MGRGSFATANRGRAVHIGGIPSCGGPASADRLGGKSWSRSRFSERVLCQAGDGFHSAVHHFAETARQMILVPSVDHDAFDALAVQAALLGTRAMVPARLLEFRKEFILLLEGFFEIALLEVFHGAFFELVAVKFHGIRPLLELSMLTKYTVNGGMTSLISGPSARG
jgi:hypothetical protein